MLAGLRFDGRREHRVLPHRRGHGRSPPSAWSPPRTSCTPRSTWCSCSPAWPRSYILLAAEFIAITQVLVYIGAIVVLFLFGIMLTRAPGGQLDDTRQPSSGSSAASSPSLLAGVMGFVLYKAFTDVQFDFSGPNVGADHRPGRRLDLLHLPGPVRGDLGAPARRPHRRHRPGPAGLIACCSTSSSCSPPSSSASASTACSPAATACMVLMSIELILNAVNINLVAFGAFRHDITGQVFALFVIAVAAAEVGVGLALVLMLYRNRRSIDIDDIDLMKG